MMLRSLVRVLALCSLVAPSIASCSSSDDDASADVAPVTPLSIPEGCNPLLDGKECLLPYPSDVFRVADASQPSGFRVAPSGAGRLSGKRGEAADPTDFRPMDGFSKQPPILALLGSPVAVTGLVTVLDPPENSTKQDSRTTLLEADTGTPVPHFTDVDPRPDDDAEKALVLHPHVQLKPKTRYVVAVHGVVGPDGKPSLPGEGFRRMRDHVADPGLATLGARYEKDVFAVTERAGIARGDLQLAWDFTTGSDESVAGDMLKVRELALAWLAANQPAVTITSVKDAPASQPDVWRVVTGTIEVPLFLDKPEPMSPLSRDASGVVKQNGTATVPFYAHIPNAVRDAYGPGRILCFGHGFFGTAAGEIAGSEVRKISARLSAVVIGIDWWGMSNPDQGPVANALADAPAKALAFTDRVHQAMANWMVVTAALRSTLKATDAFKRPASGPGTSTDASGKSNALALTYDDARLDFLGISQGHILAGTLAAVHPSIERFVLNVGGADLATMMFRARPFASFLLVLDATLDKLGQQKFAAISQRQFDRIDPGFWAPRVLQDKLPGSPADRRVLQQAGIGDVSVPNIGSFLHARALGLSQVTPTPRAVFGLPQVAAPYDGSAFALYDFGVDDHFYVDAVPGPKDTPVHGELRQTESAMAQMDAFFRTPSSIVNACDGVCDPN